jgi:hypothetical protein
MRVQTRTGGSDANATNGPPGGPYCCSVLRKSLAQDRNIQPAPRLTAGHADS